MDDSPLFFSFGNILSAQQADIFRNGKPIQRTKMPMHSHEFVETYKGLVGYGFDRETDENTVTYYLQKFSDDRFMAMITKRMTEEELWELFEFINHLLKTHLTESEYHTLFLKEDHDH